MRAVWTRVTAAKPHGPNSRHHNHSSQHAYQLMGAIHAARNGAHRVVGIRRDKQHRRKVDEFVAMFAAQGLDAKVLRQVAALATNKGMRKLAHGLA